MSYIKNNIELRGFVNFLKQQPLNNGQFLFKFSITLSAGKDQNGNYRKEYFNVALSSDASNSVAGKLEEGDLVHIEGRLRNDQYEKDGNKKFFAYVEAFQIFIVEKGQNRQQPAQQARYQQPQNYMPQPINHGGQYGQQQPQYGQPQQNYMPQQNYNNS